MVSDKQWREIDDALGESTIAVVSNRDDKHLQKTLENALGRKIKWVRNDPRRVQSLVASINGGYVDLVIVLSGFIDHRTASVIHQAVRGAGSREVFVRRGRPDAVFRELRKAVITLE